MTTPKLLLADDSASVRKIVEMTFAAEGIDVTAVGDAQSAMLTFIDLQPDIVLLDVGLSGTSGYQICEMIKQDDATRHIPVLLLVGAYEPFDEGLAKQASADGYFTKPLIPIRNLVDEVRMLLGMGNSTGALPGEDEGQTAPLVSQEMGDIHEAPAADSEIIEINTAPPAERENHDIDELYSSSFTSEAEPQGRGDLEDIYLVPTGDDDLIETSPLPPLEVAKRDQTSELAWDEDMNDAAWPLSSDVKPHEDDEPQAKEEPSGFDGVQVISFDDDVFLETPTYGEEEQTAELSGIDISHEPADIEDPYPSSWPHVEVASSSDQLSNEKTVGESHAVEGELMEPDEERDAEPIRVSPGGQISQPASAELIEQITQRVIDRLSDRVIREIAQEAVPQIAEKLIREALEEERKV